MAKHDATLPRGWVATTVENVGVVQLGLMRSPDKDLGRSPTKYLRAANVTMSGLDLSDVREMDFNPEEREHYALREGDVLLAEASGSASQVGRPALWRNEIKDCCFQKTLIRFRPIAVVAEYALLVFQDYLAAGRFARRSKGVGIQHLTAERFKTMPFSLPPWSEQERIATEAHRRLHKLHEAEAKIRSALSLLVEKTDEVFAGVANGHLGSVRAAAWPMKTVGDAGEVRAGRQLTPEATRGPHQRHYLRVANVLEDHIDVSDLKKMSFTARERATLRLQPGDILLNEGQSIELVGRPAMFRGELREVYFQNHLLRFRSSEHVDPEFALLVFRHYLHSGAFRKVARRSTNIANLGLKRFLVMPFPLPPIADQQRLAKEARRLLAQTKEQHDAATSALENTARLRHELLLSAVTGRLVKQNSSDESGAALLERLRPPSKRPRQRRTKTDITPTDSLNTRDLDKTLAEAAEPISAEALFARCGFDRDSVEDIEQYYLSLRASLGRTIMAQTRAGHTLLVRKARRAP